VILITGGTGYIGSHACIEFEKAGLKTVLVDNFSNSSSEILNNISNILGHQVKLYEGDIREEVFLEKVFRENEIDAVIHFAGCKSVSESIISPEKYYDNNVIGSLVLLKVMRKNNCKTIIFSSSATVYGQVAQSPVGEDSDLLPINPYGRSKLIVEEFLKDIYVADNRWKIAVLRYFNPVGAHISGLLGELPSSEPQNLFPLVSQVASGIRENIKIFGSDYQTKDGTGIRDYIHIQDLVNGHISAYKYILKNSSFEVLNLGTGQGLSVLDVISVFERVSGKKVKYIFSDRREGDIESSFTNPDKASKLIGWQSELGIERMCEDQWRWQNTQKKGLLYPKE
jgi:UDP-glucose 4-epimerase